MPKKLVITESGFLQLLKTLISSKLKGKEQTVYDKIVQKNPEIGRAWDELDASIKDGVKQNYIILKRNGLDTTHIQSLAKKMGVSLEGL
jgi:hypothetical protein